MTIPAGTSVLSDPATLVVPDHAVLAVSVYTAANTGRGTGDNEIASYYTATGDHAADTAATSFGDQDGGRLVRHRRRRLHAQRRRDRRLRRLDHRRLQRGRQRLAVLAVGQPREPGRRGRSARRHRQHGHQRQRGDAGPHGLRRVGAASLAARRAEPDRRAADPDDGGDQRPRRQRGARGLDRGRLPDAGPAGAGGRREPPREPADALRRRRGAGQPVRRRLLHPAGHPDPPRLRRVAEGRARSTTRCWTSRR